MNQLKINAEFRDLLPELSDEQITSLTSDIKQNGIIDPIITWNGTIVDGHHRYVIATFYNIPFITQELQFDSEHEAKLWIIKHQRDRRNMNRKDIDKLMVDMYEILKKNIGENQYTEKSGCIKMTHPKNTAEIVAEEFGVSPATVNRKVAKQREMGTDKEPSQEELILPFIQRVGGATKFEIAEEFDMLENSAGRALTKLSDKKELYKSKEKRKRDENNKKERGCNVYKVYDKKEIENLDVKETLDEQIENLELKKKYKWIPKTPEDKVIFIIENGGCVSVSPEFFDSKVFQEVFKRRRLSPEKNVETITLRHNIAYNPYWDEEPDENLKSYTHWIKHNPTKKKVISNWKSKIIVDGYDYPAGQYLIDSIVKG